MLDIKITLNPNPKEKPQDESKLGFAKIFTDQSSGRYIFKATTSDTVYSFGIIRPMARGLVPTEKTVARMAIAGMSMEKTASVCENNAVSTGSLLTYTITLEYFIPMLNNV